ncbi:RNA-binding protein 44-like [Phaenicophaeus curvirostris]|uniref:RNA-binding protein 44-like n=1 Tax=Phaenicophaeus curvirostris TaxID=33595 RepID=UPI0037F0BBE5
MAVGAVAEHSDRHIRSASVRRDNPSLSPRKRIPAEAVQFHISARDCGFYGCEESGMCMCGIICADCAMKDAESWFPVSEMLTGKNLSFGVEDAGESSCGKSSCLNSEHRGNLKNKTGDSDIDQAVDVGSDFRACFTTSRSISAQVCLSSRAINTELTTMNKSQPVEWLCETCAGVTCSADWLHGAENTEEIQSQFSDTVEERSDGNAATAVRSTNIEEQCEWCGSNLKISTDRLVQPDKQAVKDSTPSYCQKILQRAVEAELQLLNAHYKMCYQHCLKIYKLALEENICFHRCNGNAELDSSLILVLEELKKDYNSMRTEIRMGTPLSALPPLSVEITLFPISSSYVPCEVDPQTVCLLDGHQPSDPPSSKTSVDQHKDQDVECEAKITESGNECSFIRVGGLSSSVSEVELRSHFQKYQIADILICVASGNYRYAFLCFKEMNQAQLAVEEMNQKEIKGKAISVELVNDASENKSLVSQILKAKLQHEIQPVDNSQINDQDKALASASSAAKAPDATSTSEKVHLHPLTSSDISSTQVPSETRCPGLKPPTEDLNTRENLQQKIASPFSTSSYDAFVSPNALNLSSFTKLMNKLQEIHPAASSDKIVAALLEVKKNNKGVLSGLSINSIVERTSAVLKKSTPSCGWEKERKEPKQALSSSGTDSAAGCRWSSASSGPGFYARCLPSPSARRPGPDSGAAGRCPGPGGAGPAPAAAMAPLPRRFLCLLLAHHFIVATACQEADYGWMIRHYCLKQFQLSMEGIGQRLWCDWDETVGTYGELTNCTVLIAERLDCYWPNRLVDEFFVAVHKQYFKNCSSSGRALHDPPNSVLCPFILLPVLVTLMMTALVVWRSKRSEGIV